MNILIVDDEKDYCDVMELIFTSHGYEVDTCHNGLEALEKMEKKAYDLVLTDLLMPAMDGSELLGQIKSLYPATEVIMMTAYGTIEKAVETMKQGAYSYVTKGDRPEKLLSEIEILSHRKKQETERAFPSGSLEEEFMLQTVVDH